jgi:diaminopimelate decarboxylase
MTGVRAVHSVPVRPLTTPWTDAITGDFAFIDGLARAFQQPLHLIDPDRFAANAVAFAAALDQHGLNGTVYFGKKANKAASFAAAVAELAAAGRRCGQANRYGIDVASVGEFRAAVGSGVRGTDLMVTGPHKPADLLSLAVHHDAIVTVDSPTELQALAGVSAGLRIRVLLRVLPPGRFSRFGLTTDELRWCEQYADAHPDDVDLLGYSFHLSGYSLTERSEHAHQLLDRIAVVRSTGAAVATISIGGGFPVNYVSQADWDRFTDPRTPHTFHAGKAFDNYYPYHAPIAGASALDAVLRGGGPGGSVAQRCRDADVSVILEPGRALLDQAGLTVFPIIGVKDRDPGLIVVGGTSLSLSEQWFNTEFVPDPQLLSRHTPRPDAAPFLASVGAATCLESDMLTWRVIAFSHRPTAGDYLVYHNTAGYQMDSNESTFHDTALPPKLAVTVGASGHKSWALDRPAVA